MQGFVLKDLFDKERQYLNYFFDHLDLAAAEKILEILNKCEGLIFFTGVGKSEVMAQKIAVTMTSTGTRALFVSATNALHGDIGIVSEKDVFVILSKTGETEELLNLVPFIRNKGAKIIAIVSNANSRLAKACDYSIFLPVEKELCPFDLVPTTSTQIQMIFGDAMAIALMSLKKYSLDQYAKNHPSGKIGRRITTRVKDLMISGQGIPIGSEKDTLLNTLVELSKKRCGCVFIVDDNNILQGIFTDGDLGRALNAHGSKALEKTIGELMVRSPRSIGPDVLAWEALREMESDQKRAITVLAVLDEKRKLLGLIKMHDIIQAGI